MIDDAIIKAIVELGNNPKIMKLCEPNVFCPQEIHEWQVRRVCRVIELLQEAYESNKSTIRNGSRLGSTS